LDWQHNLFLHETNTLTFGVGYREEHGESESHTESMWGSSSSAFPLKKAYNTGIYLQDHLRLAGQFFLTAGLRLDTNSQSGSATTYRFAPACLIQKTGTKLKATFGTGFKSPSLYQLYAPGSTWGPIGNENLKPEEALSWDAGIEQTFLEERLLISATYFSCRFENLIDFDYTLGFVNITKATSKGAEISFQVSPQDSLLFSASYTRTEAKDRAKNENLLRRPKHKFTAKLSYNYHNRGHLIFSLIYTGKREDMEWEGWTSSRVQMPPFTLFNAALSHDILPSVQLFLRLDNILDKKYETIKGYGTPGFSAFGGFQIHF